MSRRKLTAEQIRRNEPLPPTPYPKERAAVEGMLMETRAKLDEKERSKAA